MTANLITMKGKIVDAPKDPGQSPVRVIVEWHHGNDYRLTETTCYDTRHGIDTLIADVDMSTNWKDHAANALGRPNDVHRAILYDLYSWYRIVQVWASDKRPADVIMREQKLRMSDPEYYGQFLHKCAIRRANDFHPNIAAILKGN